MKEFFTGLISIVIFAAFIYYLIWPRLQESLARRKARDGIQDKDRPGANDPR